MLSVIVLSVIMLSVIMLSVIMLSVIMLSVIILSVMASILSLAAQLKRSSFLHSIQLYLRTFVTNYFLERKLFYEKVPKILKSL